MFLSALSCASIAQAETFKSSEFLKWKRDTQDFYIRTSVGMAGLIAVQNNKQHQICLEAWYFDNEVGSNDFILKTMQRFPDYHPRGVILAVLEKQCGSFSYAKQ